MFQLISSPFRILYPPNDPFFTIGTSLATLNYLCKEELVRTVLLKSHSRKVRCNSGDIFTSDRLAAVSTVTVRSVLGSVSCDSRKKISVWMWMNQQPKCWLVQSPCIDYSSRMKPSSSHDGLNLTLIPNMIKTSFF